MSTFKGYSKMINNYFSLTDDEIRRYYFEDQKTQYDCIVNVTHIPGTTEDAINPNFLAECTLDVVNKYLISQYLGQNPFVAVDDVAIQKFLIKYLTEKVHAKSALDGMNEFIDKLSQKS